jgi:hypothetical protein
MVVAYECVEIAFILVFWPFGRGYKPRPDIVRDTGNMVGSMTLRPNAMLVLRFNIGVNLRAKD